MRKPRRPPWLSQHVHALVWLAVAIVVMGLYVWGHHKLRCAYTKEIRPQVKNAVELYALRRHAITGVLELRIGEEPYVFDPDDAGPLGIGKLPEARGVLTDASAVVERYNLALRDYIKGLTAAFYPSPNNMHHMLVPLSAVNPKAEGAEESKDGEVSRTLRVAVEKFANVRYEYRNEQTLDELIDMIRGADLVEIQAGGSPKTVGPEGADTVRSAANHICTKRAELRREVYCLFEAPASSACPIPAATNTRSCESQPSASAQKEETHFHRKLRMVVERNIGFFWVWGEFLWFEIMMLAVLGVVTRKLVVFATAYTERGRAPEDMSARGGVSPLWQPRESVRTLMQLVVAPIFSLVIIWILTLTNIISVKPLIGDVWSNGFVPIAFLLGLFPSLGYQVLRGLAEGVFGRHLVGEKAPEAKPAPIPKAPTDASDGAETSFEGLRQRVRHHALAVFER